MVPQWEEASWPLVESRTAILPGILSWVHHGCFHKAAGFLRSPSCHCKQRTRLQRRCEKGPQQYWSGEKGRVWEKALRYAH